MTTAKQIWDDFCAVHRIKIDSVKLFASDEFGFVKTKEIGQTAIRRVLVRHPDMEKLILRETDIIIRDWSGGTRKYDGLIYVMHRRGDDVFLVPLYIGKAETIGRSEGNLSANLRNLHNNKDKFARWGDNYAYHIGDLSAAALTDQANRADFHRAIERFGHVVYRQRRDTDCDQRFQLVAMLP